MKKNKSSEDTSMIKKSVGSKNVQVKEQYKNKLTPDDLKGKNVDGDPAKEEGKPLPRPYRK